MADVFISYQRAERDAVQIIANKLAELGVDVWFDSKLRAGGSFDEEIAGALGGAKAVLTCWTPAAIASEWVRGEATMAHQKGNLIACFLEPTALIPPFNLTHAEDLSAWAGQDDDPAWLKLLERIGELTGRPGLSTYTRVMRPAAPAGELRAWAEANGSDKLADTVWARISALEGEDSRARIEREKREAHARAAKKRAQEERSRQLIRERGLRDPKRERRRQLAMVAAIALIALFTGGGFVANSLNSQTETTLSRLNEPDEIRDFIRRINWWPPAANKAREKLSEIQLQAALSSGTVDALSAFVEKDATPATRERAMPALYKAEQTQNVQSQLARLRLFEDEPDGVMNEKTRAAIRQFRYRWMLPVGETIDPALEGRLNEAVALWGKPRLSELHARRMGPPTPQEYAFVASELGIDIEALGAVMDVESGVGAPGFEADGRPVIAFYPHIFSRVTNRAYDTSHPDLSTRLMDRAKLAGDQPTQWRRLEEAYALAPNEAFMATAWGKFQILGMQYKMAGVETVGELVRLVSDSESGQLQAHLGIIRSAKLADELQRHDWAGFARVYNGAGYARSQYDVKLKQAYERRVANKPEMTFKGDEYYNNDSARDDYERRYLEWIETGRPTPQAPAMPSTTPPPTAP